MLSAQSDAPCLEQFNDILSLQEFDSYENEDDIAHYIIPSSTDDSIYDIQESVLPTPRPIVTPTQAKLPRIILRDYFGHALDTDTCYQVK